MKNENYGSRHWGSKPQIRETLYHQYRKISSLPYITYSILGICIFVYFAPIIASALFSKQGNVTQIIPSIISGDSIYGNDVVSRFGFVPALVLHEPWRIVTCAFLHADLIHIAFNSYALWVIGIPLEKAFGHGKYLSIYVASAFGSGFLITLFSSGISFFAGSGGIQGWVSYTIGASGAIFGLMGATLFIVRRMGVNLLGIITVIGLNIFISFTIPGISWQGHIGGLLIGLLIGWIFVNWFFLMQTVWKYALTTAGIVFVLFVLTLFLAAISTYPSLSS